MDQSGDGMAIPLHRKGFKAKSACPPSADANMTALDGAFR